MIELLKIVTMLCAFHNGVNNYPNAELVIQKQEDCQKYYAECLLKSQSVLGSDTMALLKCIKEKKK